MSERPFRVIIVGAGPIGLYLACALSRANIDFVVLEKYHTIVNHAGAGILLWPHTLRLLDQLGLLDATMKHCSDVDAKTDLLLNGQILRSNPLYGLCSRRFGYPAVAFARSELIQILYECLSDRQDHVKTDSRIVDIETNSAGVRVHLKDGTVEEGSIVVGVDGVHSKTREIIQSLGNTSAGKYPMTTTFRGIYGKSSLFEGFNDGVFYESHGAGRVLQSFRVGDRVHYAVLQSLKTPTTGRKAYDVDEMERMAEEFADYHMTPTKKFKEVWEATDKATARLVDQPTGFTEKWYHKRIVLVGDAVHKMTSVTGQGANCAFQSAAVLANELRSTLRSDPSPTTEVLEAAFARYQEAREKESYSNYTQDVMVTSLVTWASWKTWVLDRFILSWLNPTEIFEKFSTMLSGGQVLEYVPFTGKKGTVPWLREVVSQS